MERNLNKSGAQRGHRRMKTLGKDLPAASLFLNISALNGNVSRYHNIRSDASGSFDYLNKIDKKELCRSHCLVPNNSPNPQIKKQMDIESDDSLSESVDHKYEILISDSSSDSSDGNDTDNNTNGFNPEELVSLVGNSKFYTPCLTGSNKELSKVVHDSYTSSSAINDIRRNSHTGESDLHLGLAGFTTTDQSNRPMCNPQLLESHVKLLKEQMEEARTLSSNCIVIQRKNLLTNTLNSGYSNDHNGTVCQISKKSISESSDNTDSIDILLEASNANKQIVESPHSQIEKFEIAQALAKTTALTSTAQIKQRLAARKLEIELDNIVKQYNANKNTYDVTSKDDRNHQQIADQIVSQQQTVELSSNAHDGITPDKIKDADNMMPSFVSTISEIPREILKYLISNEILLVIFTPTITIVRFNHSIFTMMYLFGNFLSKYNTSLKMGSFNSAPKINNVDSQDNNFQLPVGLNGNTLLQHVRQLRGCEEMPLLRRYFMKSPSSSSSSLIQTKMSPSSAASYFELADDVDHLSIHDNTTNIDYAKAKCIRILQWNLLSQTLGQYNDGFIRCPDKALTWQHRKFLIVEEILRNVPDIICLQEVDHFKFLQKILNSQNYEGVFFPKPDSPCLYIKENNGPDGCAIFFNRDKYKLKNIGTHILEVWRVQSNQVAIAINLLIKALNCEICVCTTHLKARRGTLLAKLRNEQGRDLLRYVKRFAGNRPVILCGDFNAEPIEPVYSTILNCDFLNLSSAYADIYNESEECNDGGASDNYNENYNYNNKYDKIQKSIRNEPPYTTWKIRENGEECHTIDYIFYSSKQFKVRNCLEFPHENEIGKDRTPSYQYPSDHFSLVCDLELGTSTP